MPEFLVELAFQGGSVVKGYYVLAVTADVARTAARTTHPAALVERIVEIIPGCDEAGRRRQDTEAGRL